MVEIVKNSTNSFLLKADIQGIEKMLMYINTVSEKGKEYIQILYSGKAKNFSIKLDSEEDEMFIGEDIIEMYMDEEELAYLEERLRYYLSQTAAAALFLPSQAFLQIYVLVSFLCNC